MIRTGARKGALDSLRWFAILAVLFDHYVNLESFRPGYISVRFFLLLSGFLITQTLVRYSSPSWAGNGNFLKSFYGRRALRIWPLYYLILLFMLGAGWVSAKQFAVHSVFLTNIVQAWQNDWNLPWYLAHVWTLCVQEQFYVVWPVLFMLLGQKRWMFLVLMIVISVLFGLLMWFFGRAADVAFFTLPFASFDALAIGSMAAMYHEWLSSRVKAAPLLVGLFVLCFAINKFSTEFFRTVILPTIYLLPLSIFTLTAFKERIGIAGNLLNWPPLVFLGRISLGIYLLHLPVWKAAFEWSPPWLLSQISEPSFTTFLILTPVTIVAATASWLVYEKPLQVFRRYLPYPGTKLAPMVTLAA